MGKDKEQIIIDGVDVSKCKFLINRFSNNTDYCCSELNNTFLKCPKRDCYFKQLARKTQECEELKTENEELNNRMAEVTYRATGGRLSYSNYTLDAIEKAFNDQLEILSDQKVEEETKELNQKLYLAQNEIHSKTKYIQEQRDEIKQLEKEYAMRTEVEVRERLEQFKKDNPFDWVMSQEKSNPALVSLYFTTISELNWVLGEES